MWHAPPTRRHSMTPEWVDYLYHRTNPKGEHAERWRHIHGCGRFFNALRDTVSDRIACVYKAGEPRPARSAGHGEDAR